MSPSHALRLFSYKKRINGELPVFKFLMVKEIAKRLNTKDYHIVGDGYKPGNGAEDLRQLIEAYNKDVY